MNIFRGMFKDGILLFFLELFLKIKAFVLIPLLTTELGVVDYGMWAQVNVIITTVYPLVLCGTDSAIIRFLPGEDAKYQKQVYATWLIFLLGCSLLALFFFYISVDFWADLYLGKHDVKMIALIILAAWNILVNIMINAIKVWYRILNHFTEYTIFMVLQNILSLVAVGYALYIKGGIYDIIWYSLLTDAVLVGIYLFRIVDVKTLHFKGDICRKLIRYGYVLLPSGYATWIINSSDRLFLAQYAGLGDIGIYALSYSLGYLTIQLFVNPIWTIFPSRASELFNQGKASELLAVESKSIKLILFFVSASIAFFLFSGKEVITFLSTSDFSAGAPIIVVVTVAYTFHMLASYDIVKLGLINKQKYDSVSLSVSCLINLGCNVLLIPKYGIMGAAIATLVAYGMQWIFVKLITWRYWGTNGMPYIWRLMGIWLFSCFALYVIDANYSMNMLAKIIVNGSIVVCFYSLSWIVIKKVDL